MRKYLIGKLKALRQLFFSSSSIDADDVQWVVNDNAELGVKVGGKYFWLYKGYSLECSIDADDVQWVVNDNAELGVKVGGKYFWLYKGYSLEYRDNKHDDGTPIKYRQVGKREFGECCHPLHLERLPDRYTDGDGWQEC